MNSDHRHHVPASFLSRHGGVEAFLADGSFEHRQQVRSLLALVRAVVRRTSTAGSAEDYAAQLNGRLDAISRSQEMLMRHPVRVDLAEILQEEFLAQGVACEIQLPAWPLWLERRTAPLFAIALHELTVHALQFGALRSGCGKLAVRWGPSPETAGWTTFEWHEEFPSSSEDGIPLDSFGLGWIRNTIPTETGARTHIARQRGGLRCQITFRTASPGH